ncbi:uncharacterized protein B4U80_05491 [Leptotrombidium deliense]|uniref:Uncharacterized protein n=1 Tax=Leptotrombidium deliense TaxID=299467 RepID=A0A443SH35_9ACAR|nr:uncharacterized protein B4U80_05491 [Leptotrombidium deliense]
MDFIVDRFENKRSTLSQLEDITNYSRKNEVYKETQDESLMFRSKRGELDLHSAMFSLEFVNLAVALSVNTVRYPSVFWKVSKSFGFLLSIIFIVNTVLSLISYSSFTVLYKMQVFGAEKFIMRYPIKLSLDCTQSLFLSVVYLISVLISSCTLYYYGLDKHEERQKNAFIKFHITNKRGPLMWGYCPHFCAFLSLMVIAFSAIPLMYDLIVVYCGTSRLIFVIGASSIASHIIFSILCWLFLTFKNDWKFSSSFDQETNKMSATEQTKPLMKGEPPLLIIQNGKTFQIRENSSKNAIIHLVHNLLPTQNSQSPVSNEDIYWLKPRPPSPVEESKNLSESCSMSWLRSKKKCETNRKTNSLKNNSEDVEYCTFREIVHRDETDENIVNSTHLSLCPLKDEPFNSTKLNGDYEVFMEPNTVPNTSVISPCSLEQRSTLYSKSAIHNEIENSCSGSLSESSTSPEKSSETSSGIHSNLSSSTEKRSNSVENLIHLMCAKQNWENKHSLQRCMPSVDKPQRVVCVANENNVNTCNVGIRRLRPHTHLEVGDSNHLYGRIPARMTSFSESDHYENSDTKSKCMVPVTPIFHFDELKSLQNTNEVNVDPSSAIAMMYQHRRRDSANFSLASSEGDSNTQKI